MHHASLCSIIVYNLYPCHNASSLLTRYFSQTYCLFYIVVFFNYLHRILVNSNPYFLLYSAYNMVICNATVIPNGLHLQFITHHPADYARARSVWITSLNRSNPSLFILIVMRLKIVLPELILFAAVLLRAYAIGEIL